MKRYITVGKRIEGILVSICLLFVFLTGCGEVSLQNGTNLQLEKDGGVTVTYIEEFPSDYYSVEELKLMNQAEVDDYNAKHSVPVVEIIDTQTDGNKLTLIMHYNSVDDYGEMNDVVLFGGTVGQAAASGYDLHREFVEVKSDEKVSEINLDELSMNHIMIIDEAATIHTYSKILYVTEGVVVSQDKKMATVTGEDRAVIVFK